MTNATNQVSLLKNWLLNIYQHTTNYVPNPNLNLVFCVLFKALDQKMVEMTTNV